MHRIAFLGDEQLLSFYRPADFTLFSPKDEREVRSLLQRLQQENYIIVFVTEAVYRMAEKTIQNLNRDFLPAVSILPGYGENGRLGIERMNRLIENAVGTKLVQP